MSKRSSDATPSTWALGLKGFTKGPSWLNTVLIPRAFLNGASFIRDLC